MSTAPAVFSIVLTGGIAAGKTAVSDHFAHLGVPIIDTDLIARQVVEPGQPALATIARMFGAEFIDSEGRLDRRKMREAIFSNPKLKQRLEKLLHPLIAAEALRQVQDLDEPYCILVIPLYAESGRYPWVDRVLVVDTEEEIQIKRVMARDRISRAQAVAILGAQSARSDRLALADDVLTNTGSLAGLKRQVEELHRKYLEFALR